MQMSREEFESNLDELKVEIFDEDPNDVEDEEFGDDGEPIKDYPDEDEVSDLLNRATDEYHAYTDTMTDNELEQWRNSFNKRFNKFLKDKNYEVKC